MYNWFYSIIASWLRRWKENSTKVSSELFSNESLDVTIVTLLGSFLNPKFFSAFFPMLFSMDILTCMNFVNSFCLHFENVSNVAFLTETSLISFQDSEICFHYTYLFPELILSQPPHLIVWHHLLPSVYLFPFFPFYLLFSSLFLTSTFSETNGLIIFIVAYTLSLLHHYDNMQHHLPCILEIQEHHKIYQVCDPFPKWF